MSTTPINPKSSFVNGLSHFKNPSAVLPTLLIEACSTSGRTYQSYKRGGKLEAKERFREEGVSAVFWLWGVKALNKLGDILGENVLKINDITDTGKDALRDPGHLMSNKAKFFKFGKIISSVVIATGLIGFVVPKINHAITKKAMSKREDGQKQNATTLNTCLDDFIEHSADKKQQKYSQNSPSFKGSENLSNFIMKASYNLENNNKWRLISTDTGMIAGRVKNSRHPAEAFEYLFRDASSIYFYNFAAANMIFLLNKIAGKTDMNPKAIAISGDFLSKLPELNKPISAEKFIHKTTKAKGADLSKKFKFDKDNVIKLDEFLSQLKKTEFAKDEKIIKKARIMSTLQPKLRGESILSYKQVEDIFSTSFVSEPEFLKKVINEATYGRALDEKKFVSRKTTEGIRASIDGFCEEIARYAKKEGKDVSADLIKKYTKKSLRRTALFQGAGMLFSAFGLAILIPKAQIFLSQKVFGKKSFEDIAQGKKDAKEAR